MSYDNSPDCFVTFFIISLMVFLSIELGTIRNHFTSDFYISSERRPQAADCCSYCPNTPEGQAGRLAGETRRVLSDKRQLVQTERHIFGVFSYTKGSTTFLQRKINDVTTRTTKNQQFRNVFTTVQQFYNVFPTKLQHFNKNITVQRIQIHPANLSLTRKRVVI